MFSRISERKMILNIAVVVIIACNIIHVDGGDNIQLGQKIREKRIIKPNKDASPNEHPWMVLLSEPGTQICGGSIITECYVLTAAHCFGIPPPLEKLTVGVHQRTSAEKERQEYYLWDKYKGVKPKYFKYYMHEDANASNIWMPDLALVRLSHPIKFIPNKVGDIHLSNKALKEKLKVQAYGWGRDKTCKTGNLQDILKKRDEDLDACNAVGGQCSDTFTNIIGKGDSGGPWVSAGMDESDTLVDCQVGVSRSCPNETKSRIMNIDFFINNGWIMKKIKEIEEEILKDEEFPKYCNEKVIKTCSPFNPNKTVDLVFVFDMSASISAQSFEWSKEVAIKIYKDLVAKGYSVLVSAVKFHVGATVQFYMKKYKPGKVPSPDVIKAINAITMKASKVGRQKSNTGKVLKVIKKDMLGNGDRSYAPSFVILFHDGVLFPRTPKKRGDVIKMGNNIEKQYHADIIGVKLKNENGYDNMGANDLKKTASKDPSKNDVFPSAGGNLDAGNKDGVAEAIVNKISGK